MKSTARISNFAADTQRRLSFLFPQQPHFGDRSIILWHWICFTINRSSSPNFHESSTLGKSYHEIFPEAYFLHVGFPREGGQNVLDVASDKSSQGITQLQMGDEAVEEQTSRSFVYVFSQTSEFIDCMKQERVIFPSIRDGLMCFFFHTVIDQIA